MDQQGSPQHTAGAGRPSRGLAPVLTDTLDTATGRAHRDDPTLPRTGGPAGNARLTAWVGLGLLVAFLAELVTLLDVRGLIGWHIALGALLVPPALLKTGTTGWRILRYYTGHGPYRQAGPPPLLLRLLGPVVIVTTLAVLGTGVVLVVLGPATSLAPLLTVLGQPISWLTLHQVTFVAWGAATGVHVLARTVPAVTLAAGRAGTGRVDGRAGRLGVLAATAVLAVAVGLLTLALSGSWTSSTLVTEHHHRSAASAGWGEAPGGGVPAPAGPGGPGPA